MNELEWQFSKEVIPLYDVKQMEVMLPPELHPLESTISESEEELERWREAHGQ